MATNDGKKNPDDDIRKEDENQDDVEMGEIPENQERMERRDSTDSVKSTDSDVSIFETQKGGFLKPEQCTGERNRPTAEKSSGILEIPEIDFRDSGNLNSGSSNGDDANRDAFDAPNVNKTAAGPTLTIKIDCNSVQTPKVSERRVTLEKSSGKRISCQPLIYEAKSSCDKGLKIPENYRSGIIPRIEIHEPSETEETVEIVESNDHKRIVNFQSGIGKDQLSVTVHDTLEIRPLQYKVHCLCDDINTATIEMVNFAGLEKQSRQVAREKSSGKIPETISMNSRWPTPTQSDADVWSDLPETKDTLDSGKNREKSDEKSTGVDNFSMSNTITSRSADALNLHTKLMTSRTTSRRDSEISTRGAMKSTNLIGKVAPKGGKITSFFVKVPMKATCSADSSVTLCSSKSSTEKLRNQERTLKSISERSFANIVDGGNFDPSKFSSNSTVTHTIISASNDINRSSSSENLDKLDPIKLDDPIIKPSERAFLSVESCPNLSTRDDSEPHSSSEISNTLINLIDLERSSNADIAMSPLGKRPKKRKRRRCNSEGDSSSSLENDPIDKSDISSRRFYVKISNNDSVSFQESQERAEGADYEKVLAENITVPQEAADSFRRTRGALVAEAKGAVRAEHLRAMVRADRIPRWALGLEPAPAYVPNNDETQREFANLVRNQAKERMLLIAESLDKKAKYFKNIAQAGMKAIKHLYGGNKDGFRDCKGLLKALAMKDKVATRKGVQKVEVSTGENPIDDGDITRAMLAPQEPGTSRPTSSKPLQFHPKGQPKANRERKEDPPVEPGQGTSTGGTTPFGMNAIGGQRDGQNRGRPEGRLDRKRYTPRSPRSRGRRDSRSRSPDPKKWSPGSPGKSNQGPKSWSKRQWDNRSDGNRGRGRGRGQGFRGGRGYGGRPMGGRRDNQTPRPERHPDEQRLMDILREALDAMKNKKKEE